MGIQIQNPFLTAQSTQIKSVISVAIKDFILITILGHCLTTYPGSVRTFTTYPGRDALLRHTGSGRSLTTYPGPLGAAELEKSSTNWITTSTKAA